jgi:hypothetical protein
MEYTEELSEYEQLEDSVSTLQLHALMFMNGDRYDIPALRKMAVHKYSTRCLDSWNAMEFLESIAQVYESTLEPLRELRDIVVHISRKQLPESLEDKDLSSIHAEITKMYLDTPMIGCFRS